MFIVTKMDENDEEFDRECWNTLLHLVEHTISEVEFERLKR